MAKQPGVTFRPHACRRCGGDAYRDAREEDPEWRCMMCARWVPSTSALSLCGPDACTLPEGARLALAATRREVATARIA